MSEFPLPVRTSGKDTKMKETKNNGVSQSKAGKRDYSAFKNMYRKIPQDLRDVIVYYIGDRPLVIHEGVNEVTGEVVTAEFIRQWHMDRDREVYNNNKHLKPPADEHKKQQIREWEEAHPGEKCPDSYNLSLDASFADEEGSEDKSSLLYECAITMGAEDDEPDYIVRLHELRDELPESQLHTYRQVVEQEKSNVEAAAEDDVSEAAVRKRRKKIEEKIASDKILKKLWRGGSI